MTRGAIYNEQAYAQGKMLDHSGWNFLPRNVTPSDIDMCFDNRGWLLTCELSSQKTQWPEIPFGQLLLYKALTARSRTIAALLKHSVKDRQINTLDDISSFQVMISGGFITEVMDGIRWRGFVTSFYDDPLNLHIKCYQKIVAAL